MRLSGHYPTLSLAAMALALGLLISISGEILMGAPCAAAPEIPVVSLASFAERGAPARRDVAISRT